MGKKGRKTRWRTLTIAGNEPKIPDFDENSHPSERHPPPRHPPEHSIPDEHSDSEESNTTTTSGHRVPKGYPQKSYYGRFTYSSQSTPTRRYQCDGTKSTRSSSTASENKITFNEDEYTRITTPRQDVLFKKGYLNKPKTYQTQTSTGNSTTSTGNSTGNGTPDHQSTDLEYESQFVFPNGFVDQNGIYYVNSFEPYPLMVFNPPTYYPDYGGVKTKRCSSGSLAESTSPNNEEASQDVSHIETPNNVSDLNTCYNVVYPGFYYGACQPQEAANGEAEPRRMKKRRRRKLSKSKSVADGTASEYTDESSDEVFTDREEKIPAQNEEETKENEEKVEDNKEGGEQKKEEGGDAPKGGGGKYDLKPDAEEFVPRAYRPPPETLPIDPGIQFVKIPSNFVPVPILNPVDFNAFLPPGIFVPQINFIPNGFVCNKTEPQPKIEEESCNNGKETVEVPKNQIDIAKIVSKLEEAAKEQDDNGAEEKKRTVQPARNFKKNGRPNQPATPGKEAQTTKPVVRNYSDLLKTPPVQQQQKKIDKTVPATPPAAAPVRTTKATNEWISVSNRKKRKNRNVEETDSFEDVEDKDAFESYDVGLLEDVIPTPTPSALPEAPKEPEKETPPEAVGAVKEEIKKEKKEKIKKKSKKQNQTKRVMIKDVDLTVACAVKEEKKREEGEEKENEEIAVSAAPVPKEEDRVVAESGEQVSEEKKETPEKKTKRKKKKPTGKPAVPDSQSSSNTTLNAVDDSYDFLLESSLLDDSQEKTNVEVSQELDKMIQRGMYSSLEEKIKGLNMTESNDAFFKTIIHSISRESSVEKSGDLSKFLTSTSQLLKPAKALAPLDGLDFLDEGTPERGGDEPKTAEPYPITKAVKEWMTKTRETTPDVEILKSPSAILREFGSTNDSDDDVTVYAFSREGSDDLLDCWEEEIGPPETTPSSIEEVEVYESKYGKNEDYAKIKEEIEEKKANFPKHGNLPYRAICCSIM